MYAQLKASLHRPVYGYIVLLLLIGSVEAEFLEKQPVGPDASYYHEYRATGPWHIHVLEIDLTNPFLTLESLKAQDQLYGTEQTSAMARRSNVEEHHVVAAVNGDFYQTGGIPVGAQVINEELLKNPLPRSVFGITDDQQPFIRIVSFQGGFKAPDNSYYPLSGVNKHRDEHEMVFYNRYFGPTTNSNFWGTEIILKYIDNPCVNDTFRVKVVAKDSIMGDGHGNNEIPFDGGVISGHGQAGYFLNHHIYQGDTLKLILQLSPLKDRIKTLIGGVPRLIRNGKLSIEYQKEHISSKFCTDRHPRTALGFDQRGEKLFFFVVDGRQEGYSVGMSLYELTEYMLEWKVYQAINLDGGGSSTMVIRNQVVNRPSDEQGERAVANALLVISQSPQGQLAHLFLKPEQATLQPGEIVEYSYWVTDQYYNPLQINETFLKWRFNPVLGKIRTNGYFQAESTQTQGYIHLHYQSLTDSAWVKINAFRQ